MYFSHKIAESNLRREREIRLAKIDYKIQNNRFASLDGDDLLNEIVNLESEIKTYKQSYHQCSIENTVAMVAFVVILAVIGFIEFEKMPMATLIMIGMEAVTCAILLRLSLCTYNFKSKTLDASNKYREAIELLRLRKQKKLACY